MELIAFGFGALIGWSQLRIVIEHILTIAYWFPLRSAQRFPLMYDAMDGEYLYILLNFSDKIRTYADFLRLHAAAKESSYELFRGYYDPVVKFLLKKVAPIVLLPALLFWTNWYVYLFGVATAFTVLIAKRMLIENRKSGHYVALMMSLILNKYQENQKQ